MVMSTNGMMLYFLFWVAAHEASDSSSHINPFGGETLPELGENNSTMLIKWYNSDIIKEVRHQVKSEWAYSTNITTHNENIMIQGRMALANFTKKAHQIMSKYNWQSLKNEDLRRQFKHMAMPGQAALSQDKLRQLLITEAKMLDIFTRAAICPLNEHLKPVCMNGKIILDAFSNTNEEPTLKHLWRLWHDNLGSKMRQPFKQFVKLSNELSAGNNYSDLGALWRSSYDWPNIEQDVEQLLMQIKPLYLQLHAYARRKLREVYGSQMLPNQGLIPAHLIGCLFSHSWTKVNIPFPNISNYNFTNNMLEQNYTVKTIVEVAEHFFVSLGFSHMPKSFWNNSIFEDPGDGRQIMCHGTAWDFYENNDFRMLICSEVNYEQLYIIHHEMGHIHYFIQYKNQPYLFRTAANPAFHEAIGDLILLSVMTPKHLHAIGLLNSYEESYESDINFLFTEARSTIAPLPFSYMIDRWRWDVFSGKVNETDWNKHWWNLKGEFQGISPPVKRKDGALDAGVIFHVATFAPYLRYFLSGILKYQFHRSLCKKAGEYEQGNPEKPLHKCDIYGSKEAGDLLRKMLVLGASKRWDYTMNIITEGENKFDASALMEYFQPLMEFLENENAKHGEKIGWASDLKIAQSSNFTTITKLSAITFFFNVFIIWMSSNHIMA